MAIGSKEVTLKSRFSRVLSVLVIALCVVTEVALIFQRDPVLLLRATAPLALLGFGAWTLFWAPLVRVGPAGVEFVNPLRTFFVTWPAIRDIETRWGLTLVTQIGKITAWAAPAQSRYGSISTMRRDVLGRADYAAERKRGRRDNLPTSVAGLAPYLVHQQWTEYREAGLLHEPEGTGVRKNWHTLTIIVLAVLLVASVVAGTVG